MNDPYEKLARRCAAAIYGKLESGGGMNRAENEAAIAKIIADEFRGTTFSTNFASALREPGYFVAGVNAGKVAHDTFRELRQAALPATPVTHYEQLELSNRSEWDEVGAAVMRATLLKLADVVAPPPRVQPIDDTTGADSVQSQTRPDVDWSTTSPNTSAAMMAGVIGANVDATAVGGDDFTAHLSATVANLDNPRVALLKRAIREIAMFVVLHSPNVPEAERLVNDIQQELENPSPIMGNVAFTIRAGQPIFAHESGMTYYTRQTDGSYVPVAAVGGVLAEHDKRLSIVLQAAAASLGIPRDVRERMIGHVEIAGLIRDAANEAAFSVRERDIGIARLRHALANLARNTGDAILSTAAVAIEPGLIADAFDALGEPYPIFRAIGLIATERRRQIERKGWTPEHDADNHPNGQLADAASAFARSAAGISLPELAFLPCSPPNRDATPLEKLTIAGALIVAEMERIARAESKAAEGDKA